MMDYIGYSWESKNDSYLVLRKEQDPTDNHKKWKIRHLNCGTEFYVRARVITTKARAKCPCCHKPSEIRIGERFGRLVVSSLPFVYCSPSNRRYIKVRCLCDCGVEKEFFQDNLLSGVSKSCGCRNQELLGLRGFNLEGSRFGYLTVLYLSHSDLIQHKRYWRCYCNPKFGGCGEYTCVSTTDLRSGNTKSCGCGRGKLQRVPVEDLTDKTFGYLSPCYYTTNSNWFCYCDPELGGCGGFVVATTARLKNGHTSSCGCKSIELFTGANNPNWNGGCSDFSSQIRGLSEMRDWIVSCLIRDNHTCQYSGQRGGDLSVHHIKPFAQIIQENNITTVEEAQNCKELWDTDNGITLARQWHLQGSDFEDNSFHNIYGCNNCTKQDFQEWFSERPYNNPNLN